MKLNPIEKKVLEFLVGQWDYWSFEGIRQNTRLHRKQIRRACRSLRRKGLSKFSSGLWTEDGDPAGSGYAATRLGRDLIANTDGERQQTAFNKNKDLEQSAV